jgi:methyl-accepting chemotaxis protein
MLKPANTKRIYLINRDFQLRYTKIAVAVGLISTILTIFLIMYPLFHFRIVRFPNFLPTPFIVGMVIAALINFSLVAVVGVIVTHKIAGPIFSLVRHMRTVQMGRLPSPMQVRTGDDMKYLIRNFNELLEYLSQRARADKAKVDAIAQQLDAGNQSGALTAARELSQEIEQRLIPAPQPES